MFKLSHYRNSLIHKWRTQEYPGALRGVNFESQQDHPMGDFRSKAETRITYAFPPTHYFRP